MLYFITIQFPTSKIPFFIHPNLKLPYYGRMFLVRNNVQNVFPHSFNSKNCEPRRDSASQPLWSRVLMASPDLHSRGVRFIWPRAVHRETGRLVISYRRRENTRDRTNLQRLVNTYEITTVMRRNLPPPSRLLFLFERAAQQEKCPPPLSRPTNF